VAAPATVSGEPQVQYGHWETGKAGPWGNDPRARRPASAVTQPVDGASIRSGLSQRWRQCRCEGRERTISHDIPHVRPAQRCLGISLRPSRRAWCSPDAPA